VCGRHEDPSDLHYWQSQYLKLETVSSSELIHLSTQKNHADAVLAQTYFALKQKNRELFNEMLTTLDRQTMQSVCSYIFKQDGDVESMRKAFETK
jgi:hypothetical protein